MDDLQSPLRIHRVQPPPCGPIEQVLGGSMRAACPETINTDYIHRRPFHRGLPDAPAPLAADLGGLLPRDGPRMGRHADRVNVIEHDLRQ